MARSASPSASRTRASPRAEIPSQHGSPIWQALANDCSRQARAPDDVAPREQHVPEERLRPRQEGQPVLPLGRVHRGPEVRVGCIEVAAQETDPAQHRQPVGLATRLGHVAGGAGRVLEEGPRAGVVAPIAGDRAEVGHRLRPGRRRRLLRGQHLVEQPLRAVVARPEEVHVAELGPCVRDRLEVTLGDRDPLRLGEGRQPGLVEAAERVDQRLGEHQPGLDACALDSGLVRHPYGRVEGRDPGHEGPGRDGCCTSLGDRVDRGGVDGPLRGRPLLHGQQHRCARRAGELALRRGLPGDVLAQGGISVAGEPVDADQERLVVLVQGAHCGRLDGEVARPLELTTGQQPQRRLVDDRLGRRREAPALGQQPRLERLRVGDGQPLEEVQAEPGEADRVVPVAVDEHVDVDRRPRRQGELDRVAVEPGCGPQAATHLREAPAQGPQRVVGLGEQQRGQPRPRRRPLRQEEEGQHRPALAAAEAVAGSTVDLDPRAAEQVDGHPCRHTHVCFMTCSLRVVARGLCSAASVAQTGTVRPCHLPSVTA